MAYTPQTWADNDTTKPLSAARLAYMESGIQAAHGLASGTTGGVPLDSFPGLTDDDKLTNALSFVASQTVKPPILFDNRRHNFSQAGRLVFSGLKLVGPNAHGNQQRSANSIPNDIRFTGTGAWWQMPASGNVFDVGIYGLSFQGNSNAIFMAGSNAVLWTSVFRDLGFNLWKHVLGTPTVKMLNTAVLFDGWWNVNNSYDTAFTLGGSDSNFWMDGMLIDAEPANMNPGKYHIIFDYQEKSTVGPMFMTADQSGGMWVQGSESRGPLVFFGNGRIEGRNTNTPSFGSNLRISGGHVSLRDWWISYGATALNTQGRTGEGGLITMTGGRVLLDGCMYSRANGVAETVPWVYQTGGKLRVRNIWTCDGGGTWTGLPRVRSLGGTVSVDDSVTLVQV